MWQWGAVIFATWWDSAARGCQNCFFTVFVGGFSIGWAISCGFAFYCFRKILLCVLRDPRNFCFFFNRWVSGERENLRWFQIRGNNLKKKKSVPRESCLPKTRTGWWWRGGQTSILHTSFACNFLLANFAFLSTDSESAWDSGLFWCPYSGFVEGGFLGHIGIFWGFGALFAGGGSGFWGPCFYGDVLELLFTPIRPWTSIIFLRNIIVAVP